MDIFLQLWGGLLYLANKICFALAEGQNKDQKRILKIFGWSLYILGVPAWVIILILKHNWIAASIEAGGIPAMILGLITVHERYTRPRKLLSGIASASTYGFIVFGISYSLLDYGGITSPSQVLEFGVTIGFLLGSYLLAKNNSTGYLFFMLMNLSMGALMLIQHKPILAFQQCISLCFVFYGFILARRCRVRQVG